MVVTLAPRGLALNTALPSSFVFLPLYNDVWAYKVIYIQLANIMFFLLKKKKKHFSGMETMKEDLASLLSIEKANKK